MSLPESSSFEFPQCWEDDVRMNSLFAPFRTRSINPTDWDSKMKFWDSLIEQWCFHHRAPIVDLSVLNDRFRRKDKLPSCLPVVVEYLQKNKTLISKNDFYRMTEKSWKSWAVQVLITNPLQWTFNKVKSSIIRSDVLPECVLIHLPTVKKLGLELLGKIPEERKGKLLDINYLKEICEIRNPEVIEMVLHWLSSQGHVALHQTNSELLIKFPNRENTRLEISDVDKALFSLEQKKRILESNIKRLEQERDKLMEEAKRHVSKNKLMAKASLRRKKMAENIMHKITDAVDNIENLIYQMQMTEMDSMILDCYQTGVVTLNKYFKDNGLTKDRVEETRNELEEILIFKSDIDKALAESFDSQNTNEEDVEEELNKLLEDVKEPVKPNLDSTNNIDSVLDKLPEVPICDPNKSVGKLEEKLASLTI